MTKFMENQKHKDQLNTLEMEREKEFLGLCSTCKNGPTCMFLDGVGRQILHCEEFQVFQDKPERQHNIETNNFNNTSHSPLKGLCATCDNLVDCSYDKPECGIWHCEEYA